MAKTGIWLSYNNQEEGFELPVLPAQIDVSGRGDGTDHHVHQLGNIHVIKDRQLQEYAIESIFPSKAYPFITASIVLEPKRYVEYIQKWWQSKRPIRFIYVGPTMEINTAASIETFDWKEVGGTPGDIEYALKLKEYRFYAARPTSYVTSAGDSPSLQKQQPERPNERQTPSTHTLQSGESLWTVSQQVFGTPNRWREIQRLNGISDAQLKKLPVGMVLKLPGAS